MKSYLFAVAFVVLAFATPQSVQAQQYTEVEREAIKAMPLLERPYRPLHVYGNNVRRANSLWQGVSGIGSRFTNRSNTIYRRRTR